VNITDLKNKKQELKRTALDVPDPLSFVKTHGKIIIIKR
jgi:hypothetical protein